jgi:hypothetical protein
MRPLIRIGGSQNWVLVISEGISTTTSGGKLIFHLPLCPLVPTVKHVKKVGHQLETGQKRRLEKLLREIEALLDEQQ